MSSNYKTHNVDGFKLKFTGRRTWEATLEGGGYGEVVPVTWVRDITKRGDRAFVMIYCTTFEKMTARRTDEHPFIVAVAAKDNNERPMRFRHFDRVLLCRSTFKRIDDHTFKAEVLKQLHA